MDQIYQDLIKYAKNQYLNQITSNGNAQYAAIINASHNYNTKFNTFNASITPVITRMTNLINPYFIGMGNPYSTSGTQNVSISDSFQLPNDCENSILIFGQELAFSLDIANTRCFFEEQLSHHDLLLNPDSTFFNPYRANDFRLIKKHSHTWGVYSKFVAGLVNGNSNDYKKYLTVDPKSKVRSHHFEDYCFFTELYDKPSATHNHTPVMSPERISFFQSNEFRAFISRFKYIIIGDGQFSRNYSNLLKSLFGIVVSQPVQTLTDKSKVCQIIKNKNQHIAISNYPLSGRWKFEFIDNICTNLI